jgi:hypothetical protein
MFDRTRLLLSVIVFGFYGCHVEDNIAPSKPPLPPCGNSVIEGYTDKSSYFPNEVVNVFLQSSTDLQCGLGFYDSKGKLAFSADVALYQQIANVNQPWKYGYNFSIHSEVAIPRTLPSGVYFIENQIPIIVKSSAPAKVTVVYPFNTISAYNSSGGKSLYGFNSTDYIGSPVVSFLRPLSDRDEHNRCDECLKWLPSLTDISFNYISDLDLDNYSSFAGSKVLVIAGHSEYWTRRARNNFDRFVSSGGHSVLLSGNSMWWQARYSDDRNQLICYRDATADPEPNPLMKTILWTDPQLNFSIVKSIGSDFNGGGYGLRTDNGWNGYKIVNPASPLLEGLNLKRGDIVSVPSDECDGAPIKSFDADGFPILDNTYNFEKLELIGFDKGTRGGVETFPTFIAMRATPTSGVIVNMGASDWCSPTGVGHVTAGYPLKTITRNAIRKLVDGVTVFSD